MIEKPEYYKIEGEGNLFAGKYNFNVVFNLYLINQVVVIYCKPDHLPIFAFDIIDYSNDWTIKGNTSEKELFFASELLMTEFNNEFIELISNNNVIIGEYFDTKADQVTFPLANLFNIDFETYIDGFKIKVRSQKNQIKERISKYWKVPQIGADLVLEKANEKVDSYSKIARLITYLLSLGTGRQLNIGIQKYKSGNKSYTLIQNNFDSASFITELLLPNDLPRLLTEGIKVLKSWEPDKIKDFRSILEYLNGTDIGYVDDRILSLVQSYEIIAHKWLNIDYKLPHELNVLKQNLKPTIKAWREQFPDYDPNGFWSGRIYDSLQWGKTVKLLEGVIESQNFDLEKLHLDFNVLVKLRHEVAHSGRFVNTNPIDYLQNGQFALRLFLLKIFGFNGKVNDYRGKGWIEYKNINEFEKSPVPNTGYTSCRN